MHRVKHNQYVGQPNEVVRFTTAIHGDGTIGVTLDGQDIGDTRTFSLPSSPGQQRDLHIDLAGSTGASCGVGISPVDGGTDGDLLLCQPLNPKPAGDYAFQVATIAAVQEFGAIKNAAPPAAKKPVRRKPARKGGR